MSDKVFLDTNVIIYAHTDHDLLKQEKAQSIIIEQNVFISTQVISAAIEAEADILYSEDMQHNQVIEKQIRIVNPFI